MLSRVCPIIRRCNSAVKFAVPVINSKIKINKYPEVNQLIRCQNMSTVPDEILNESSRNLDYSQLLEKKRDPNVVLIDVREPSEINETGKLPGSIHIPLSDVKKAFGNMSPHDFQNAYKTQKPNHDTQVIFSCRSGRRSLTALKTAIELGYKNAAHYKGGWLDWAENTKTSKN